jgi:protocatechuate 3,4-dioxygenase beta subunit
VEGVHRQPTRTASRRGRALATTDASGNWSFKDLIAGAYTIRIVQQTGYPHHADDGQFHVHPHRRADEDGLLFGEKKLT